MPLSIYFCLLIYFFYMLFNNLHMVYKSISKSKKKVYQKAYTYVCVYIYISIESFLKETTKLFIMVTSCWVM